MKKKITISCFFIFVIITLSVICSAKETYKITYDFGVADIRSDTIINNNPKSYTKNDVITLSDPECPGFEFIGWYAESDYKTKVTEIDTESVADITLYAKWYEMTYNINYILETPGISLSADEITHLNITTRLASETIYLSAPVCNTDVYSFAGWYFDSDYKHKADYIEEYTCKDITLYALWLNNEYTIHYELGAVEQSVYPTENPNPDKYKYNNELILIDATTNDPAFVFDGWYTDEFFTQKIEVLKKGTSGEIVLYAKWNVLEYNINYVFEDFSGIDISKIHNNNPSTRTPVDTLMLNAPVSEDRNFTFSAWYTSPDYSPESKVTSIAPDVMADITLYAKWEKAVYNINYNYGVINLIYRPIENNNPKTYEYGDNKPLSDIEADGFIFNGWCTDAALKNKVTSIPEDAHGDITLYADFTEKTYSISYVLAGKEVTASQVVNLNPNVRTTTQQISLEDAETINTEYEFDGWYLDPEYSEKVNYIRAYTTGNITLYAKWTKIIVYLPCWGDATLSEQLSAADARLILRYSAGLETGFTELQKRVSDINNDEKVNAADARLALRLSANIEKEKDLIKQYNLPDIKIEDGEVVFR